MPRKLKSSRSMGPAERPGILPTTNYWRTPSDRLFDNDGAEEATIRANTVCPVLLGARGFAPDEVATCATAACAAMILKLG
jgi:hypothetical protein